MYKWALTGIRFPNSPTMATTLRAALSTLCPKQACSKVQEMVLVILPSLPKARLCVSSYQTSKNISMTNGDP